MNEICPRAKTMSHDIFSCSYCRTLARNDPARLIAGMQDLGLTGNFNPATNTFTFTPNQMLDLLGMVER